MGARLLRPRGFTLVEVGISVVILTVALLGLVTSASVVGRYASEAQSRARATQALQERVTRVGSDPRYARLEELYAGVEDDLPGLEGMVRTTTVTPIRRALPEGGVLDYTVVRVVLTGPSLPRPLSRRLTVAAP